MSTAEVTSGVCGFPARIVCEVDDGCSASLHVESDCERVQAFARLLERVAVFEEIRRPMPETAVYLAAGRSRMHAACPVPCATLKAIEVAAGLALPADVSIVLRR